MIDYPKQKEAIEFDGGNILVSASAGSGKTFTMIERVKRLILEKGVDVNSILAVTFTEAAASDMKAKLKKALSDKIGGKDDARIVKQLAEIPTADISTLHSFCGRLIRRYFFAVGLSPDFSIIDESDATVMRLECVNRTFKEFYDSEEEWFYTLVDRHAGGRTDQKFKELILTAYAFCVSEADPDAFMDKYKYFYSEDGFNTLLSDYKAAFDEQVAVYIYDAEDALKVFAAHGLEKAVKFTESLIADMKFMVGQKDVYGVKKFENYSLCLDVERKLDPMVVDYKNAVSDVRDNLKKLLGKFGKNLNDRDTDFLRFKGYYIHTEGFIKVLRRFNEIYSAEKREENVLDFNDLEHFALKVLSDETICQAVKAKYKHVFVDHQINF